MSERPIERGDVVYVHTWPCCGVALGVTFRIGLIETVPFRIHCSKCNTRHEGPWALAHNETQVSGRLCMAPLPWLRRIPPLTEPETTETSKEITA